MRLRSVAVGPRHSTRKCGRQAVRAGPSQHACAGTRQTRCCAHGRSVAALRLGHLGVAVAVGPPRCCCATAVTTFENPLQKRLRRALRLRQSLPAAFFGGWADRLVRPTWPCVAHVCDPCLRAALSVWTWWEASWCPVRCEDYVRSLQVSLYREVTARIRTSYTTPEPHSIQYHSPRRLQAWSKDMLGISTGARAAKPPPPRESSRWRSGRRSFASRDTTAWPPADSCRTQSTPLRSPDRDGRTQTPTPSRPPH